MFDVAQKLAGYRLLRHAAMIAVVGPMALLAACTHEEPAPPPQPVVYQAPPPPPAPPLRLWLGANGIKVANA